MTTQSIHFEKEGIVSFRLRDPLPQPCPLPEEWILSGTPEARMEVLSTHQDTTLLKWECTAGSFLYIYDVDEIICIECGSAKIDYDHTVRTYYAGETVFFRAGTAALWAVPEYVRKTAVILKPRGRVLWFVIRALRKLGF